MRNTASSFFEELVKVYKNYLGDNLISIVLFGSHARGDAKATSDYDIFIITEDLPRKPFQRLLYIREPIKAQFDEKISIIAKTREEVLNNFPPLFLDLGLDGVILFDREDFFNHLQTRIREIIQQAGLERKEVEGEFYWAWMNPPRRGWEITWSGFREL